MKTSWVGCNLYSIRAPYASPTLSSLRDLLWDWRMSLGTTQWVTSAKHERLNAALTFVDSAVRAALVMPQGSTGRALWNSCGLAALVVKRRGMFAAKEKSLNLAASDVLCCTFLMAVYPCYLYVWCVVILCVT